MSGRDRVTSGIWRRPMFWVVVTLAVSVGVGFLYRPRGQSAQDVRRSLFRTTPDGVAALARTIERLGRPVQPRLTPFLDADPVRGTIVLIQPRLAPSPRETNALLDRVRTGGTLVYAPHYVSDMRTTRRTVLMDSLGISFRFRGVRETIAEEVMVEPRWGDHALTEGLAMPPESAHGFLIQGTGREAERDEGSTDTARTATVDGLLTMRDSEGAEWMSAAVLGLGKGRAVVFSDSEHLSNAEAGSDPLAVLAVRAALAYTEDGDSVFFAEFHQGVSGRESGAEVLAGFFLDRPEGRALLHLIVVCLVVLACAGLRFGSPMPAVAPPDMERRSPLEHVSALGNLYRKAGAAETAALLLLARLARATRHPPPHSRAEADALLRVMGREGKGAGPLDRIRDSMRAATPDLKTIADGIDEHLSGRLNP